MPRYKKLEINYKDGQVCTFWGEKVEIKENHLYLSIHRWNINDGEIKNFIFDGKLVDIHQDYNWKSLDEIIAKKDELKSAVIYKSGDCYSLIYSDNAKVIDMDFSVDYLKEIATFYRGISEENIFVLD